MKKVLIIVYYWPPAGGGGVQRWLKFVQYLPEMGWEPIVYTAEDADYPLLDPSLEAEVPEGTTVIRQPIWEPRKLYQKFTGGGKKKEGESSTDEVFYLKKRSWKQNLSLWIRGNFFIPDARTFWVKPSVRFLEQYLKEKPVDAIITTGPPHSLHLIGRQLRKLTQIPWLADFRDPWTEIEFYDKLMLTPWADRKHKKLEKAVIQEADAVSMVTYHWADKFREMGAKKSVMITNGYDEKDFAGEDPPLSEHFVLAHVGTLALDRNPSTLWQALADLSKELSGFQDHLRIQLVGKTDPGVIRSAEEYGLGEQIINSGYVGHEEAVDIMRSAQILLLLINQSAANAKGRMTGKIFEYLAANRPIFCIGTLDGDPARVIRDTQSGVTCEFDDLESIKSSLLKMYLKFKAGKLKVESADYERFSRKNTTRQLAEVLGEITS